MRYLRTLAVPGDSVAGPDLNRAGGGAASADRVGHPSPVARLHHAEPDALPPEEYRAVRGHVKNHPGVVREQCELAVDGIDLADNPLGQQRRGGRVGHRHENRSGVLMGIRPSSSTTTDFPSRASRYAVVIPAIP